MDEDFDMPAAGGDDDMMMDDFGGDDGPVMKVGEEKEVGKQGLKKKLLKEGEGWETPEVGDEVEGIRAPASSQIVVSDVFQFDPVRALRWVLMVRCGMPS